MNVGKVAGMAAAACAGVVLSALLTGCGNSVQIALTDSTGVHVGTFEVADTPIPAVSYSTGPRFFATTRKDCTAGFTVYGSASITNETHALGIYDSVEVKNLVLTGTVYSVQAPTNGCTCAGRAEAVE